MKALLVVSVLAALAGSVQASSPRLNSTTPPGAQRGTELTLNLYGARLDNSPEIVFTGPGIKVLKIDSAKTKWVGETKAIDGTPVTMANLKSQLGGKEVKPVVDETYDPMPVGQPPTATLPANKTLGSFSGGDVLTVASLEAALANSSALNWNLRKSTTTAPSPTPTASRLVSPKPRPSVEPSVTAPPEPSPPPSLP